MKKTVFTIGALLALCLSLTGCKTNENAAPRNTTSAPSASVLPNTERSGVMPDNGHVTDGNGIIGDEDDLVYQDVPRENSNPVENAARNAGEAVNNAADHIGDAASNITSNAGNIVSNVTSNVGDTISNIADNAGDTVENAADNAADALSNQE